VANHANVALGSIQLQQQSNAFPLSMYAVYVCYSGNPAVGSVGAPSLPDIVLLLSGWWKYVTYYQLTYSNVVGHNLQETRLAPPRPHWDYHPIHSPHQPPHYTHYYPVLSS
jgi:hypothetical protein